MYIYYTENIKKTHTIKMIFVLLTNLKKLAVSVTSVFNKQGVLASEDQMRIYWQYAYH